MSRRDWVLRKSAVWLPTTLSWSWITRNCMNRQCGISSLYADDEERLSHGNCTIGLTVNEDTSLIKAYQFGNVCSNQTSWEFPTFCWVCSPIGRGNTFRAYVVWVRIPPYPPFLWVNLRGKDSGHRKKLVKLLTHVAIKTQVLNRLPATWLVGSSPTTYTIFETW